MQLAIAGAASGCPCFFESQLDRITRRLRTGWRTLLNLLESQP